MFRCRVGVDPRCIADNGPVCKRCFPLVDLATTERAKLSYNHDANQVPKAQREDSMLFCKTSGCWASVQLKEWGLGVCHRRKTTGRCFFEDEQEEADKSATPEASSSCGGAADGGGGAGGGGNAGGATLVPSGKWALANPTAEPQVGSVRYDFEELWRQAALTQTQVQTASTMVDDLYGSIARYHATHLAIEPATAQRRRKRSRSRTPKLPKVKKEKYENVRL